MCNDNEEFLWLKKKFERDEIKVVLEHDSYEKSIFTGDNTEVKFNTFIELFLGSLITSTVVNLREYRGAGSTCNQCGERLTFIFDVESNEIKDYVRNKETKELERTSCNKIGVYSFEIEIPTGEILCCDRLPYSSDMLANLDEGRKTLNSSKGIMERTLTYAKSNIFHIYVGNTCPSLYMQDSQLKISVGADFKPIANICTDLWWTSLVDVSLYKKMLVDFYGEGIGNKYINSLEPVKTHIPKGVYRCTYLVDSDLDNHSVYATLERIRDIE